MTIQENRKKVTILLGSRLNELLQQQEPPLGPFDDEGLVFGVSESDEICCAFAVAEKMHLHLMKHMHVCLHEIQGKEYFEMHTHPAFPEFCGRPMLWCSTALPTHVRPKASQLYTVDHEAIQIPPPIERSVHQAENHAIQIHLGGGKHGPKGKRR